MTLLTIPNTGLPLWLAVLLCFHGFANAEDKPTPEKISGVLEAVHSHEISASTEQIDALTIKKIFPHGTTVRKGQNLVWFETEDIDKKVKEAEIELRLAKLALDDDEFGFKQFLESQTLDRDAAERGWANAQQDYDNFVQVDREQQIRAAEFSIQSSRESLEGVREELEQLEQMYKEDDLTEESEEIVLKRARRSVEVAEYMLQRTEISSNRTVDQSVPRAEKQQEETLAKAELAYRKSLRDLDAARQRREIEINRHRDKWKEQEKKLAELRTERKRSVLTSPVDGIVFHGPLTRSKLSEKPSDLKPSSKVTAKQVLLTVADPSKLQVRVDLEEKLLAKVCVDEKCKVTFPAFEGLETSGKVKFISVVPYASTKYDCVITLGPLKDKVAIYPTMTCELEFATEEATEEKGENDVEETDAK